MVYKGKTGKYENQTGGLSFGYEYTSGNKLNKTENTEVATNQNQK